MHIECYAPRRPGGIEEMITAPVIQDDPLKFISDDSHWFVLADCSFDTRWHQKLGLPAACYRSLFDETNEASLGDIAPMLISLTCLTHRAESIARRCAAKGGEHPMMNWLKADCSLDELAQHLRQFHEVNLSERQSMILRYYDTRVLSAWIDALHDNQRTYFFGPIRQWRYQDRFGDWQLIDIPKQRPPQIINQQETMPYTLSDAQLNLLLQAARVDSILPLVHQAIPEATEEMSVRALYNSLKLALHEAQANGVKEGDDEVMFCSAWLITQGRFIEHPSTQALLEKVRNGKARFSQTWLQLPAEIWEARP